MAGTSGTDDTADFVRSVVDLQVQSHFGRALKYGRPGDRPARAKDWAVFAFFRLMRQSELKQTFEAFWTLDAGAFLRASANPSGFSPGITKGSEAYWQDLSENEPVDESNAPATASPDISPALSRHPFFRWLSLLTSGRAEAFSESSDESDPGSFADLELASSKNSDDLTRQLAQRIEAFLAEIEKRCPEIAESLKTLFEPVLCQASPSIGVVLEQFGETPGEQARNAISRGLPGICLFEILRHFSSGVPGLSGDPESFGLLSPVGRFPSSALTDTALTSDGNGIDSTPVTLGFTHSGLSALGLDAKTLASFPEVFKDGMAARSSLLGDTGPSAPEAWDGVLGQPIVHGFFSGGFDVSGGEPVTEGEWAKVRKQVRTFNDRRGDEGLCLRAIIGLLFQLVGMEIVHLEIGQDPYRLLDDPDSPGEDAPEKLVDPIYPRREHFGFRDGISQPFVNLGDSPLPPGSGTAVRGNSWDPIAPGELFLGAPDEDGQFVPTPLNKTLRDGGTYVVFRKLEQDVAGWNAFLANQRASEADRKKLAAEFMGRWQNGVSLVDSSTAEIKPSGDDELDLNDFRYAADDPHGLKCPLGAHARRSNPRDIGGQNNVRRHRILRRSMGYGGALLPPGSAGDGEARGMLFIAVQSRIDLQFEMIQSNWINRGEFLGQVGLGACPIVGPNDGRVHDAFLEAGEGAPVTHLPRFVTLKGGDYFFSPSVAALKAIADGQTLKIDELPPYSGFGHGDTTAKGLFNPRRIAKLTLEAVNGTSTPKTFLMPGGTAPQDPASDPVVFVRSHKDVKAVLDGGWDAASETISMSMAQQNASSRLLTRGSNLLLTTDPGKNSKTAKDRARLSILLDLVWRAYRGDATNFPVTQSFEGELQYTMRQSLMKSLRRGASNGYTDLVQELASNAAYAVARDLFGTPGPDWVTELAISIPFSRSHFGQLNPDWLKTIKSERPEEPGLATMQLWSILINAEIIGNVTRNEDVTGLAKQASSELLNHLDTLVFRALRGRSGQKSSLLETFAARQADMIKIIRKGRQAQDGYPALKPNPSYSEESYANDVVLLMYELSTSAVTAIPSTFGTVMSALLDMGTDLTQLVPILEEDNQKDGTPGLYRLIYETVRLKPSIPVLFRRCIEDYELPDTKVQVCKNSWVVALLPAANLDQCPFKQPTTFSLHPYLPGPPRPAEEYLMFGVQGGTRECWGHKTDIAPIMISECLRAASRLPGLTRVAGEAGETKKFAGVNTGLAVKFSRVANTKLDLNST